MIVDCDDAVQCVKEALGHAYRTHGRLPWGRHEFYGILKEEIDELWDCGCVSIVDQQGPEQSSGQCGNKKSRRDRTAQLTNSLNVGSKKCRRLDHQKGIRVDIREGNSSPDPPPRLLGGGADPILARWFV